MDEMTQSEYAKHRQVSRVAVTKWKQKGLLVFAPSGKISVNQTDKILDSVNRLEGDLVNKLTTPVNRLTTEPGERFTRNEDMDSSVPSDETQLSEPDNQISFDLKSMDDEEEIPELPNEMHFSTFPLATAPNWPHG